MKMIAIAALGFAAGLTVQDRPEQLVYDLDPPGFTVEDDGIVCMHYLPASDNFAANVNLIVQPWDNTLAAYDELSKAQFAQMGWNVLRSDLEDQAIIYEYTGRQQGMALRWYSKAVKRGGKVYLVTATGLADKWDQQSDVLIRSVESFGLPD